MKLTQVLLRKRKMLKKPQAYVRNWQWNNAWYLNQERKVNSLGMREALAERDIPIYEHKDLLSPAHPYDPEEPIESIETVLKPLPKDSSHPLYHETPARTYANRSWFPRNHELQCGLSLTNSLAVPSLRCADATLTDPQLEERLDLNIRTAYIGDAVQKKLPVNWKVPYIGWHPVESVMRPRNQYKWDDFSWGRKMPREYGIPIPRLLKNLTRGLLTEALRVNPEAGKKLMMNCEKTIFRQLLFNSNENELMRLNIEVPFSVQSSTPVPQLANEKEVEETTTTPLVDISPLSPTSSLYISHIYRDTAAHPITSTLHSKPYLNTVFDFHTSNIGDPFTDDRIWNAEVQRSRCLMFAFTAALGQARLLYGNQVEGKLPKPVVVNSVSTNGVWWEMASFQLNSLDMQSDVKNLFFHHPDSMKLIDFCGYRDARPELEGLNMDTFKQLTSLVTSKVE